MEESAEPAEEAEKALPGESGVIGDLRGDKSCDVVSTELPIGAVGKAPEPDLSYRGLHTAPTEAEGLKLSEMSADERAVYGVDPEGMVTIYRSTPKGAINSGDWVSTSKDAVDKAGGAAPTTSARVRASDLVRRAGDEEDAFGYVGPHLLPTPPHKPQGILAD
jgi:hypothetical protein